MPIYEYECDRCACRFELKRSFSDDTPVSCPECGGGAQRIFSPVPIIFKGSGFYVTDHRGNHGHSAPVNDSDGEKPRAESPKAESTEESK